MSHENEVTPEESKSQVDPHRATRELERQLLGGQSVDGLRDRVPAQIPSNWRQGAELIGTFVETRDSEGNITERFERVDDSQRADEPQPSS